MAEALRVLIGFIVLLAIGAFLLVTCGVGGIALWINNSNKQSETRLAKIDSTLRWKEHGCDSSDYPLALRVQNNSDRTIIGLELDTRAYRPNYSNNVAGGRPFETDRIIRPGEIFLTCLSQPPLNGDYDPSTLTWSGKISFTFN
ncbi:hypothetical protein [Mesorhizobium sp.]|uniref:hypothetical protein n=1 Tax=Mesorhizobium sp. TaxID=1871066 RepID=UPI00120514F4|nr:hypothetical protein [Mesorhizobium sp.]TIP11458.1 MAG: hypothetical protein E5X73_17815 [Mesorhizobium sp.]